MRIRGIKCNTCPVSPLIKWSTRGLQFVQAGNWSSSFSFASLIEANAERRKNSQSSQNQGFKMTVKLHCTVIDLIGPHGQTKAGHHISSIQGITYHNLRGAETQQLPPGAMYPHQAWVYPSALNNAPLQLPCDVQFCITGPRSCSLQAQSQDLLGERLMQHFLSTTAQRF